MKEQDGSEKVLVLCEKHWSAYIPVVLVELIFFFILIAGFSSGDVAVGFFCFAVATIACGIWSLSIRASYISLSQTGIAGRSGLIKSVKLVAPISKIQNLSISNGLGGKIFGYHNVIIATAGTAGNEIVFKGVTNGELLQQTYMKLADRVR